MTTPAAPEPFTDLLRSTDGATADLSDLAALLRLLRRRRRRQHPGERLTYRRLAMKLGSSHGIVGEYLAGHVLPPPDRLDDLAAILGGTLAERRLLADLRDDIEDTRRRQRAAA
jgi:transcriptional regulator with XRE-family HTH domain